jgi:deazaflavin-dependent oxidoreductase (nitroreductase family)
MDQLAINRHVVEQFRRGGPVEGMHRERLLLLTTVGARTGRRRTAPMMVHREGDRVFVIASGAGTPSDPAWYRNLVADPHVTVEIDDATYETVARPLEGEELEAAWARITAAHPFFLEHAERAGRTIPVVEVTPAADARPRPAAGTAGQDLHSR